MSEPEENRFQFTLDFQLAVLRLMLTDSTFYLKVRSKLKPEYFGSDQESRAQLAWFFRRINEYIDTYQRLPNQATLKDDILHLDADKRAGYVAILDRIFNDKAIKDIHTDYVRRNLTGWLRSNLFVSYTKKSVAIYNTGNHDNAYQITKDMLDELVVSDVQDEHTADFSDVEGLLDRAKQSVVNAIPMGIPQFEQEMGGGLQPQTLTVVLGGTNVGKTTFCISLAYYAAKVRKKVCMVVLEDEEEPTKIKFLSRFAEIPMNKLYGGYAVLSDEEKARLKKVSKVIEKYITLRFQYGVDMDVESLIDYVSQKHKGESPFDLVIIDYGQILSSKRKADGAYELQKYVHRALKQMANTLGVAVVTPAQGNRLAQKVSAIGSDYLKVTDLADCFARGTPVLTSTGYKSIEEIQEGDLVLTHKGNLKKVLACTCKGEKQVVSVKFMGLPLMTVTPEHKLFLDNERWISADQLNHEISWTIPHPLGKCNSFNIEQPYIDGRKRGSTSYHVEREFAWMLGLCTGDGCIAHDVKNGVDKARFVVVCVNKQQEWILNRLVAFYNSLGLKPKVTERGAIWDVKVNDCTFATFVERCIGRYSTKKHVPWFIWESTPDFVSQYLQGLVDADGCGKELTHTNIRCSNPFLMYDVSALLYAVTREPISISEVIFQECMSGAAQYSSLGITPSPYVSVRVQEKSSSSHSHHSYVDNSLVGRKHHFTQALSNTVEVWDLMVDGDESFTVLGGIPVHNCFELARVANNVITINRSDKDQKSDRIVFYLAKQRRGRVNIAVESVSDYATQLTHRADRCFELNAIESINDKIPEDEVTPDALPKLEDL